MQQQWIDYQLLHAKDVETNDDHSWTLQSLKYVGGLDITFSTVQPDIAIGCLVVCEYPLCKEVLTLTIKKTITVPYIPGLLGFREVDLYQELLEECKTNHNEFFPEVVLVDGNGYYHPRRFGSATHVGYNCKIPSIGVAKTVMLVDGVGKKEVNDTLSKLKPKESGEVKTINGEVICSVIKPASGGKNPIIVSVGHRVSLATKPIRLADLESRRLMRKDGLLP
ncbi:Endonuclease V [Entamoeba marina]